MRHLNMRHLKSSIIAPLSAIGICLALSGVPAKAELIPVYNGQAFGTLLNPTLDPGFDANAPAPPVVNSADNPVVAVYDSVANVTWMSDNNLFQEQYSANIFFLSTLVGDTVVNPDGSSHVVTANDFNWASDIQAQLASVSGTQAWIVSLNRSHYLGVTNWTLPLLSEGQSLWSQLTTNYPPNSPPNQPPCSTLISEGFSGCGYYGANVGPFIYLAPSAWTADTRNLKGYAPGNACWWSFGFGTPRGKVSSCLTYGWETTAITPGYQGQNQESSPGDDIENFGYAVAVVRCNVFNVPVPGQPANYGACK
jgi:hypothetical protein